MKSKKEEKRQEKKNASYALVEASMISLGESDDKLSLVLICKHDLDVAFLQPRIEESLVGSDQFSEWSLKTDLPGESVVTRWNNKSGWFSNNSGTASFMATSKAVCRREGKKFIFPNITEKEKWR